ncbi:SLBB domain-containing protein [Persicitalea sp.]|uniref:SLBB domain-containing protein n=1 Tax=Persicitalea sp. TaxID=3100273 RepID=UPI0035946975
MTTKLAQKAVLPRGLPALLLLCLCLAVPASAQTPDPSQMSNSQLMKYYQQAKASGMSDMQIEQAAMARGFTLDDIAKLRGRLTNAQSENPSINRSRRDSLNGGRRQMGMENMERSAQSTQFDNNLQNQNQSQNRQSETNPLSDTQRRIFGASLFNKSDNQRIDFAPNLNLATPKNYVLGPEDELIVDIYGNAVENFRLDVSPEGTVKMLNLAPVYVNGLTIEEAKERIISRLRQAFSGLNRSGSGTYATVTLGNVRSIKVIVTGEVARPGSYSLSSLATAFNALYYSGGPTESGSLRKIEVIRDNNVVAKIDLYQFLLNGELKNNVGLKDQDIIMVYPYQNRVELLGEVKHEGLFETKSGETFADLIQYAGGYASNAYTAAVQYRRNNGRELRVGQVSKDNAETFTPQDGDVFEIGKVLDRYENMVLVEGSVYRPGMYAIEDGLRTVKDLISKAEGLQEDAFLNRAVLERKNDLREPQLLAIDLRKLMRGETEDIQLKRDDKLIVKSVQELQESRTVSIQGAVNKAYTFPYAEGMTVSDLIYLADGYAEAAIPYRIEVARRIKGDTISTASTQTTEIFRFDVDKDLKILAGNQSLELAPFDVVFVRKSPNYEQQKTIVLEGEVMYPGRYAILNNAERISDVIQRAGGLKPSAFLAGARLTRQISDEQMRDSQLLESTILERRVLDEPGENVLTSGQRRLRADSLASLTTKQTGRQLVGLDMVSILNNPDQPANILVQQGDSIIIPRRNETVRIMGEVLNPSIVNYDPSFSFSDYIAQAGGYSDNARRNKAYVAYANGRLDRTDHFLFFPIRPKISPGTTISVPAKLVKTGRETTPGERIAILSLLSTLAITVIRLF